MSPETRYPARPGRGRVTLLAIAIFATLLASIIALLFLGEEEKVAITTTTARLTTTTTTRAPITTTTTAAITTRATTTTQPPTTATSFGGEFDGVEAGPEPEPAPVPAPVPAPQTTAPATTGPSPTTTQPDPFVMEWRWKDETDPARRSDGFTQLPILKWSVRSDLTVEVLDPQQRVLSRERQAELAVCPGNIVMEQGQTRCRTGVTQETTYTYTLRVLEGSQEVRRLTLRLIVTP